MKDFLKTLGDMFSFIESLLLNNKQPLAKVGPQIICPCCKKNFQLAYSENFYLRNQQNAAICPHCAIFISPYHILKKGKLNDIEKAMYAFTELTPAPPKLRRVQHKKRTK